MTKILVIEDEQLVRENILDLLEAEGFDAIGAENGHVGITWAWDRKPDLIICDVMMPELDGYEVLKLLRKEPTTAIIPFIFLTAKADKCDLRQGMQLGADDYLTKPFTTSELLGAIATRLERQAAVVRQSEKKLEELRQSLTSKPRYTSTAVFDNEFSALKQSQFTGQLLVKTNSTKEEWAFYLYLGRILYATGGTTPMRRWQRNVSTYCPQIKLEQLNLPSELSGSAWEYQLLNMWLKQELINREQASQVIAAIVAEVIFDSMQAKQAIYQIKPEAPLPAQLLLIDADMAIASSRQSWQAWQNAKFSEISPNQAPIIKRPEELQQKTSAAAYKQLTVLLNGQHSLRDLALLMKRQVIEITSSLLPYIHSGIVELVDVGDLASLTATILPPKQVQSEQPLIACIDDSHLVCQTMERILTDAGYQFVAIEDPLRALATLLNRKPDLIFLDLVMPNLNGYEICARLRKIPTFSDTPIVILTSNIIDRVRAKVVGSSDYINKPIKADILLATISKHLSCAINEPQEVAI